MKVGKKLVWSAMSLMMASAVALTGCGSTTPAATPDTSKATATATKVDGGDLVWGSIGEPSQLNPLWSTDTASSDIYRLVLGQLYHANQKLQSVPEMADGMPQVSSDNLTWVVKLKKGITFSDGKPLTADDVVFTFNIPLSKDYAGPRKSTFAKLKKVEKVDDLTVKFTLSEPYAPFQTGALSYPILPEHILKDVPIKDMDKNAFSKSPVGSGPYKLQEWKAGQYLKLVRNDNYWDGKPSIATITYKIVPDSNALLAQVQAGEVNFFPGVDPKDFKTIKAYADSSKKVQVLEDPALSYSYIGWNEANPLFQDKKVRQALTMAIDRKAIVDNVLQGHGSLANAPTSPISWAYDDKVPVFDFNVAKAKQMLADAGWKPGTDGILEKDGKKFEFELQTNQGNKAREAIATIVQQELKDVGIKVTPRIIEWSSFISQYVNTRKFDAVVLGWSLATDPDPTSIWHSREIPKGLNFVAYSNPTVDKLSDENTKILDQAKRKEVIDQIQTQIAEDQPYTFLYYPNGITVYPANLQGIVRGPAAAYEMWKWYFTK